MGKLTHYERAFETYLQERRLPYVAVDQAKKAVFAGAKVKSFDFLVYPPRGRKLLIDVKGRKCPWRYFVAGRPGPTWTTRSDVEGLAAWEEVFGPDYLGVFVFAYWLFDAPASAVSPRVFTHEQRGYAFVGAELSGYQARMRSRSPRWGTVYVPARITAGLTLPFRQFVHGGRASSSR
jgi:hypothetical protein